MLSISPKSIEELNQFLKENTFWANGKNIQVDHLHATCAGGPREVENIFGIYLTRPEFSWMALWMAVTSRKNLRKRNISYNRPEISSGDYIGSIEVFSEEEDVKKLFCNSAYLYLFNPQKYEADIVDCSKMSVLSKISSLENKGFLKTTIQRNNQDYVTHVLPSKRKTIVSLDEWQVLIANFGNIIPDIEVYLTQDLILELSKRVVRRKDPVGDNYLI